MNCKLPEGYSGKLIAFFDCSQSYGPDIFFQQEDVHVVDSPLGKYLETSGRPLSRFGYRFPVEHPEMPHMLVLQYPDDKRRHMMINDCFSYDLSTGIMTGGEYELTGAIQTIYYIFYTRTKDMTLTVTGWGEDEPAAVFRFAVYELDSLSQLPAAVQNFPTRKMGLQYEDPCGAPGDLGAMTIDAWGSKLIEYVRHTGQNILVYPIHWYAGPLFDAKTQPGGIQYWVVLPDHTQYDVSSSAPDDWISPLLDKCEEAGVDFVGGMTLLRMGNLLKNMNIDLEAIAAGKDTYNNMRCDNQVQTSCNDWTVGYNPINIEQMIAEGRTVWNTKDFIFAYGEKRDSFGSAPMLNPLHPEVQRQLSEYFEEISQRYGKKKAFKGISINIWHATMLWFGSLMLGYDDYTVSLFENETGIRVPCDPADPQRFEKRFTYLTCRNRKLWMDWRCQKIHGLFLRLRDALRKHNPALQLYICAWNEPVKRTMFGQFDSSVQYPAFLSETDFLRAGGIDLSLFVNDDGINLSVEQNQHRDRGWDTRGSNLPIEECRFFHDLSYMDRSWSRTLLSTPQSGAFIMDSWNEGWGQNLTLPFDQPNSKLDEVLKQYPMGNIHHFQRTLKLADDGFWFDSQRQITSCYPVERNYLEPFAHAIAETDPLYLLRGGLYLDKSHAKLTAEYTKVFTKLPAIKFDPVSGTGDPVTIRALNTDGRFYAYAINREPYPVTVVLRLNNPCQLVDLGDGTHLVMDGNEIQLTLNPFGLRGIVSPEHNAVLSYDAPIPEAQWRKIETLYLAQLDAFRWVQESGIGIAGLSAVAEEMTEAYANRKISRLRHILKCYVSEKAKQLFGRK